MEDAVFLTFTEISLESLIKCFTEAGYKVARDILYPDKECIVHYGLLAYPDTTAYTRWMKVEKSIDILQDQEDLNELVMRSSSIFAIRYAGNDFVQLANLFRVPLECFGGGIAFGKEYYTSDTVEKIGNEDTDILL